ncbi:hypothetical protein SCP_1303130 [Sparassis crispa]|uniref:Uncharacterized protein n=1 Tax=Sparassis crispa TaxID=139825 RepID=A0A401H232_9APHY|nr:hypothetical protein SCP_1303130 [Sparassis crispa]GBE88497.1 hypothetical protein SCP_1303130 [Sparassis crispa]
MLPTLQITGLMRAQKIFSISTGINVNSLSISSDTEFYLFMDMRAEKKWASFNMTPCKWVEAAEAYNSRLEALNSAKGLPTVWKTPRALMDKLGELEPKILICIASKDYTSKRSNSEMFWMKHYLAVTLLKTPEQGDGKWRKTHTCTRCKRIMWPAQEGSRENHRKSYCTDGVRQTARKVQRLVDGKTESIMEEPPNFPQPQGIFMTGTHFHPVIFLKTIEDMYEQLVVQGGNGGALSMEFTAFTTLLEKRLKIHSDGMALFELYSSLEVASTSSVAKAIVECNEVKYLHVDCLCDEPETRNA